MRRGEEARLTESEQKQNLDSRAKKRAVKDPHLNPLPNRERGRAQSEVTQRSPSGEGKKLEPKLRKGPLWERGRNRSWVTLSARLP